MVSFKVSELSERNYREGDVLYLGFTIRSLKSAHDGEIWLQSEENQSSVWLTQDKVVYGDAYKYMDGDIILYNGCKAKVVQSLSGDWFVLNEQDEMFNLNPNLINTVIKENNVL